MKSCPGQFLHVAKLFWVEVYRQGFVAVLLFYVLFIQKSMYWGEFYSYVSL